MSLTPVRSTPTKQISSPSAFTESPGNWKHPRLAEITERQARTTFSQKNVLQIVYNVVAIAGVQVLRRFLLPHLPIRLYVFPLEPSLFQPTNPLSLEKNSPTVLTSP